MVEIPGYKINKLLYKGGRSIVYNGFRILDNKKVILKVLTDTYPSRKEIARFRKEYEIMKELEKAEVDTIKVYSIEPFEASYLICMEDIEGESIKELIRAGNLNLTHKLNILIKLTRTIEVLHKSNIIHKDINPFNIIYNLTTSEFRLIDFGISSLLSKEQPYLEPPKLLEGMPAYISPEQSGRMNATLDYRTDFYSLGATAYEILTGCLPFDSSDILELIYYHLVKIPKEPIEVDSTIPLPISNIIMKLLSKRKEDRYKSAGGILFDLEYCLNQIIEKKEIGNFTLAAQDHFSHFEISSKIYGREFEIDFLISEFSKITDISRDKKNRLVLITGLSGIGKTALVQELFKPITKEKAFYTFGKFDQFLRGIPYFGIVLALENLLLNILVEEESVLLDWKSNILNAVGGNGKILLDFLPSLEMIIGQQPPVLELPPTEAQNRFNNVLVSFLEVFLKRSALVIFLDDLQWIDDASLKFLELILTNTKSNNLLVIGAYRDSEVNSNHPVMIFTEKIKSHLEEIPLVKISPLKLFNLQEMLSDTFSCSIDATSELANLILDKTKGNPFFVTQFLKTLYEEGCIEANTDISSKNRTWKWDLIKIKNINITSNVVDLMIKKINNLPSKTKRLIFLASCIGNRFDIKTLALVSKQSLQKAFRAILPAIEAGFVIAISKPEAIIEKETGIEKLFVLQYKFVHDRIQQAANLIESDENKRQAHLEIGRMLLAASQDNKVEQNVFILADHFKLTLPLLEDDQERIKVLNLNLLAAEKSKLATAYKESQTYISTAISIFEENELNLEYDLTIKLYKEKATVEFLNGNFNESEKYIRKTVDFVKTALEKAEAYQILITQYTLTARYPEAISAARTALALINIHIPEEKLIQARDKVMNEVSLLLGNRPYSELANLKQMKDPDTIIAMRLLTSLGPPTYRTDQKLWAVIVSMQLKYCLVHGDISSAVYTYTSFGGLLGYVKKDFSQIKVLLDLTLNLNEKYQNASDASVAYLMIGSSLRPWCGHLKEVEADYLEAYKQGLNSGNLQYAAYAFAHNSYCMFYRGVSLEELEKRLEYYVNFANTRKNQWAIDLISSCKLISKQLRATDNFNENNFLDSVKSHKNFQVVCIYKLMRSLTYIIENDFTKAFEFCEKAKKTIISIETQSLYPTAEFYFLRTFLLINGKNSTEPSREIKIEIIENIKLFKLWASVNSPNYEHKYLFLKAEYKNRKRKFLFASALYDKAILSARNNDFIQYSALANERAGRLWHSLGKQKFSIIYFRQAYIDYKSWGALNKLIQIENEFSDMNLSNEKSNTISESETLGAVNFTLSELDVKSLVEISLQISREIQLEKLIQKLIEVVLKTSGSKRLGLFLIENSSLGLKADIIISEGKSYEIYNPSKSFPTDENLFPDSIINFCGNTRKRLILNSSKDFEKFETDPYIIKNTPESILVLPIINHGKLTGIIYLENNQASLSFSDEKVNFLELLSLQIAIALENAILYVNLQMQNENLKTSEENYKALYLKAEQATKAKTRFLAVMTHELRTPMNSVLGNEQLLRMTSLSAEQEEYTVAIRQSANTLLALINEILDFSRIESGKVEMDRRDFNLHELVKECVNIVKFNNIENANEFILEIGKEVPDTVNSDNNRIKQILINLLSNANKFTKNGKVSLLINCSDIKKSLCTVIFKVLDTGIGISTERASQIFEPFEQADVSVTRDFGGTGLGLSISKKLVELLGGVISLETTLGLGSSFSFSIPVHISTVSQNQGEKEVKKFAENIAEKFPLNILVAEDNGMNRKLIERVFLKLGYKITTAVNGKEAVEKSRENNYDFIFMDIDMPILDGISATKQIISEKINSPSMPIFVALTANVIPEDVQTYFDAGMKEYLPKPIPFDKLKSILLNGKGNVG